MESDDGAKGCAPKLGSKIRQSTRKIKLLIEQFFMQSNEIHDKPFDVRTTHSLVFRFHFLPLAFRTRSLLALSNLEPQRLYVNFDSNNLHLASVIFWRPFSKIVTRKVRLDIPTNVCDLTWTNTCRPNVQLCDGNQSSSINYNKIMAGLNKSWSRQRQIADESTDGDHLICKFLFLSFCRWRLHELCARGQWTVLLFYS